MEKTEMLSNHHTNTHQKFSTKKVRFISEYWENHGKNQVLNVLFVMLKSHEKMFLTPDSTNVDIRCAIDVINT